MKWMAVGEVGSFVLGLVSAIAAYMKFDDASLPARIMGFLAVLYLATKWSLWFVHLGFDGKASGPA